LLINHHSNAHTAVIKNGYQKKKKKKKKEKKSRRHKGSDVYTVRVRVSSEGEPADPGESYAGNERGERCSHKKARHRSKKKKKRERERDRGNERKKRRRNLSSIMWANVSSGPFL